MSNALATQKEIRTTDLAVMLSDEGKRRSVVMEYVATQMIEGTDYGVIPGTADKDGKGKKALLKPGAEKLIGLFSCYADPEITARVEDWDKGLFHFEFRVRIRRMDDDKVLAVGIGSANSYEGRYRYRNAERTCPACGKAAIIKGKAEYGGGWVCFGKKGGCGAKFPDDAPEIVGQEIGKVENPDIHSTHNTVLKQAKKRATVDAALTFIRGSDLFEQGEDNYPGSHQEAEDKKPGQQQPAGKGKLPPPLKEFAAEMNRAGLTWAQVMNWMNQNEKTGYGAGTKYGDIPAETLLIYFNLLKKEPTAKKPDKQPTESQQPNGEYVPADAPQPGDERAALVAVIDGAGRKFFGADRYANWLDKEFGIHPVEALKMADVKMLKGIRDALEQEAASGVPW